MFVVFICMDADVDDMLSSETVVCVDVNDVSLDETEVGDVVEVDVDVVALIKTELGVVFEVNVDVYVDAVVVSLVNEVVDVDGVLSIETGASLDVDVNDNVNVDLNLVGRSLIMPVLGLNVF
jgi:hypothetical protein